MGLQRINMNVYALHAVGENNDGPVPLGSLMRDGLFADRCTLVDHKEKKSKVLFILVDCMKYYEGINLAFDGTRGLGIRTLVHHGQPNVILPPRPPNELF